MKSYITTLVVAVFALVLPSQLSHGQESSQVVAAESFAPVIRTEAPIQPVLNSNPGLPPVARYAAPPQLSPTVVGMPASPISYNYGGVNGGRALNVGHSKGGASCTAKSKSGDPNCICPQCRRSRRNAGTWGSVEFMHLWMKGRNLPPLATTSPVGTPAVAAGVLPTEILFGNTRIGKDRQSAGRVDFGLWLDPCQDTGLGFRLFGIEGDKTAFYASSTGTPILSVPFYNVDLSAEDAVQVAYPGLYAGSIQHRTTNDLMMGEAYARMTIARGCGYRVDFLGGYHVARLDDGIGIGSSTEVTGGGGPFAIGTTIDIWDTFKARNEMHGGEIGLLGELTQGPWSLKGLMKVTVANNHQSVTIDGNTIVDAGGGPVLITGTGTFAQASNVGVYERDKITYIPEVGLTLGYDLNACVKMTAGYTFAYFPHVVMAGDHIDRRVSPSQVSAFPVFGWAETEQWAQAISFGVEWSY